MNFYNKISFIKFDFLYRFYPGVSDALKFASSQVYIVTTKQVIPFPMKIYHNVLLRISVSTCHISVSTLQGRFADALLRELAGITLPPERIYGLGSGLVSSLY